MASRMGCLLVGCWAMAAGSLSADSLEWVGVTVTPHVQSDVLRYRRPPEPGLGARVQMFVRNTSESTLRLTPGMEIRFRGKTPDGWLGSGDWTWHDLPSAWPSNDVVLLPPGHLTVWSFNGRGTNWGVGTRSDVTVALPGGGASGAGVSISRPDAWISAVTFLGPTNSVYPDTLVVHVANATDAPVTLRGYRLWLPEGGAPWRSLAPGTNRTLTASERFPQDGILPPGDPGGFRVHTGRLPLTYAAIEVQVLDSASRIRSLWAHLRIKREVFDLSGGWVAEALGKGNTLHEEAYLKTLRRMHINAGMHQEVPGYTDNPALYDRYPLKYMNRLQPWERYDTEAVLPRIHAVEFLGEPQFGGGRPVPPMDVWRALAPYQATRLPTSVTHSEERIWRLYAGLSDYPHYDAYRVTAPAPDSWGQYDRWGGQRIRWGAPLETIGDMTRSLRDLNRPMPVAYWSQGAHDGWERYGGRQRTSPTPDELRSQAYHALSSRITSLYWFNLSLKSLVAFRDLIEPITRVDREIRMIAPLLLEGDAFRHERRVRGNGAPDWDLASVCGPQGALLFALDLDYVPDPSEKVFRFGSPRPSRLRFALPEYLKDVDDVFRIDADGIREVRWQREGRDVLLEDTASCVAVYVATTGPDLRSRIESERRDLIQAEAAIGFDPAGRDADFEVLARLARGR